MNNLQERVDWADGEGRDPASRILLLGMKSPQERVDRADGEEETLL
jgi:hypothetical protein